MRPGAPQRNQGWGGMDEQRLGAHGTGRIFLRFPMKERIVTNRRRRALGATLRGLPLLMLGVAGCEPIGGLAQGQAYPTLRPIQVSAEGQAPRSSVPRRRAAVVRYAGYFDGGDITATETPLPDGTMRFAYATTPGACAMADKAVVPAGTDQVRFSGPSGDPPARGLLFTRTAAGWRLQELGSGMHACSFTGELRRR